MSFFGAVMSKIFPTDHAGLAPTRNSAPLPAQRSANQPFAAMAANTSAAMPVIEVERVLNRMAAKNPAQLNWRTSIVDLMKLLEIDSSLTARRSLAQELHYDGNMEDTAMMDNWLHKEVMRKFAENRVKARRS